METLEKETSIMSRFNIFSITILLLFSIVISSNAYAQLEIDVDPSQFRKYPIAVVKFKNFSKAGNPSKLSEESQKVLMNDLDIVGKFEVLNPKSFLVDSKTHGINEVNTNFTKWLQVGAEGLVKGGFWITGDKIKLDMRLFDVAMAKEKLKKIYEGELTQARYFLHQFADEIVKYYTKEQSIFNTKIVAVRKVKKSKQIYICDFDGANGYILVSNGNINLLPAWSRDGKWVFFTSYINNNPDLYKTTAEKGGKILKISSYRGLNVGATLSPDGKMLALTLSRDGNSEIYAMNIDGSGLRRVTHSWGIDSSPTWAPDSKRIAFVSDRSGSPQIYFKSLASGTATRLTFHGNYNQSPVWSPKGDKIAFCGRDERYVFDLFLVDVETRKVTRLTQDQGTNEDPSWSPNGSHIVFSSNRTKKSQLYIMNADGTNQRRITFGKGEFTTPDWSPLMGGGK